MILKFGQFSPTKREKKGEQQWQQKKGYSRLGKSGPTKGEKLTVKLMPSKADFSFLVRVLASYNLT